MLSQSVEPFSAAGGQPEQGALRVDAAVIGCDAVEVEIKIWEHIAFCKGKAVGVGKHQRVLSHLVIPFGDAEDGQAEVFTDVKLSGADKVADIFNKQQVCCIKIKLRQNVLDAHRLNVAGAVGIELHGRNLQSRNLFGVDLARDVPFNHAD